MLAPPHSLLATSKPARGLEEKEGTGDSRHSITETTTPIHSRLLSLSLILLSPHLFFPFFLRALSFLPSFSHSYSLCSLFLTGCPLFPSPVYFLLSSNIFHITINCVLPQKSWHRYKNRQNYNTLGKFKQEKM